MSRMSVAEIKTCSFALIQLSPDWKSDMESFGLFPDFAAALKDHYAETYTTETAFYYKPRNCDRLPAPQ